MIRFEHRAISASAGTGKTWALTHRYLALLAAGAEPDHICALTFSRKAAGEIFDSIVDRLCASVENVDERAKTARMIEQQATGLIAPRASEQYASLLRRLLDQAHRLRVGTLDSFLLGVARAFPFELGLPPDVQPMDQNGAEAQAVRQTILLRLLDPRQREQDGGHSGAAWLDAVRRANFGREGKSLAKQLDRHIEELHDIYREHARKHWGTIAAIWPEGRWWDAVPAADLETAGTAAYQVALQAAFGMTARASHVGAVCASIAAAGAAQAADQPWPDRLSPSFFPTLMAAAAQGDAPELMYYRKAYAVPVALWPPLRAALAHRVAQDVRRSAEVTAGIHLLLSRYDLLYADTLRHEGRLTFDEFARRLGEDEHRPSQRAEALDRLYIDYRMDGQLDHWLLDEFQDTSDMQWQAIANLIDEVVQDAERGRTFFYVGDIKQSIYGWRGGNCRLFSHVRTRYGLSAGDTLSVCHRSLPAIVETVNVVFSGLADWTPRAGVENGPHPQAVQAFMDAWQDHESARTGEGYAAMLEVAPGRQTPGPINTEDEDDGGYAPAYEAIARVLDEVQPLGKRLSVAVLVRSNTQGQACTDVLRKRLAMPVVHEGTGGIVDHPVVTLLLALVRYAAHPADTCAWRHIQMSPWAESAQGSDWLNLLPYQLMEQVHEHGFAGALRVWGQHLLASDSMASADAFARQRLNEFLAAAESFDATGSRDADAFDDAIRAHQVKSEAAAGAIRVMTVHQCKGLGFDMVLVPFDPRARSFVNTSGIRMLRSDIGQVLPHDDGWMLKPPVRDVLEAAGGPPIVALEAARAEENFSQLCVLYVAMTRAKQACYLFVPSPAKVSAAVREADLLRETLDNGSELGRQVCGLPLLYEQGDPNWCQQASVDGAGEATVQKAELASITVERVAEPLRSEPSKDQTEGEVLPAKILFDSEAGDVRRFGLAIHRLFERISWIEEVDLDAVVHMWRTESMESATLLADVETQFRRCVAAPAVRKLLSRPPAAELAEVWRELPFDYVYDADGTLTIVSGRFDRLIVERDKAGRPVRATVVDFKSHRVNNAAAMQGVAQGYRRQMQDYAIAAARVLGLPSDKIGMVLLFTRMAATVTTRDDC